MANSKKLSSIEQMLHTCRGILLAYYLVTAVDIDMRIPRQAETDEGDEATSSGSSPPGTTPGTTDGSSDHVIAILVGTLAAMCVVVLSLAAVTTLAIVWGFKMSRRRREERELVLRTKHDIFEGVPNYTQPDSPHEDPFHNVLDSASPTSLDGKGSCTFVVGSTATETTLMSMSTEESTEVLIESRDNPGNKNSNETEI